MKLPTRGKVNRINKAREKAEEKSRKSDNSIVEWYENLDSEYNSKSCSGVLGRINFKNISIGIIDKYRLEALMIDGIRFELLTSWSEMVAILAGAAFMQKNGLDRLIDCGLITDRLFIIDSVDSNRNNMKNAVKYSIVGEKYYITVNIESESLIESITRLLIHLKVRLDSIQLDIIRRNSSSNVNSISNSGTFYIELDR